MEAPIGKRSDFKRRANDFYETFDPRAVAALAPHLLPGTRFVEPCAGKGVLMDQLTEQGHELVWAGDIEPGRADVNKGDALTLQLPGLSFECFITTPPWTRQLLHPMIVNLSDQAPTWLLYDADWMHTRQAAPFRNRLRRIVSVGRLRWMPGTTMDGKDNCAWYLFDRPSANDSARFYGRAA